MIKRKKKAREAQSKRNKWKEREKIERKRRPGMIKRAFRKN